MRSSEFTCGRCGHHVLLHGRYGHGHCRHGHASWLQIAVETLRAAIVLRVPEDKREELIDAVLREPRTPCACKRATKKR